MIESLRTFGSGVALAAACGAVAIVPLKVYENVGGCEMVITFNEFFDFFDDLMPGEGVLPDSSYETCHRMDEYDKRQEREEKRTLLPQEGAGKLALTAYRDANNNIMFKPSR